MYQQLNDYLLNPSIEITHPFLKALKYKSNKALQYFKFALDVHNSYEWDADERAVFRRKDSLYKLAVTRLNDCKDKFLKDRYAFQVIKLAHEVGLYDDCIKTYNSYFSWRKKHNFLDSWSLSRKAGALYAIGDTLQGIALSRTRVSFVIPTKGRNLMQ